MFQCIKTKLSVGKITILNVGAYCCCLGILLFDCVAGGWKRTEGERTKNERARKKSGAVGKISVAVQNSFI